MKRHLLTIGTILMSALLMAACSDDDNGNGNGNEPKTETLYLVEKIAPENDGISYTFAYNSDYTLKSITSTNVTYNYIYKDGKLSEIREGNEPAQTFTYEGNTITSSASDGVVITYTIATDGKIQKGVQVYNEAEPRVERRTQFLYDSKGRIEKMDAILYVDDEAQEDNFENVSFEYEYDDKNAILYSGALPKWFCDAFSVLPATKLSQINNFSCITSDGGWSDVPNIIGYEYNDDDYPVASWSVNEVTGEMIPNTKTLITYKKIEITIEEEE